MSEALLKDEKYLHFRKLFGAQAWKQATLEQLQKDFQLAGYEVPTVQEDQELEEVIQKVSRVIDVARRQPQGLENLIYRIDLPQSMHPDAMEGADLAALVLFRCFQKVWLRKQYQSGTPKDETDAGKNELKP